MSLRFALVASIALCATPVFAQNPTSTSLRGTIESVANDGTSMTAHTRAGEERTLRLTPKTRFTFVVPATLADVKPGAFIGVAALPGEGGELKAMEVHVFPEAMRGTGEGFRPYDLAPRSSMTNGDVATRVDGVDGAKLTVTYKGGRQTIVVDPKTPIVAFEPATRSDLKSGAAILARGPKEDDGSIDARFVLIGKGGFVPPL